MAIPGMEYRRLGAGGADYLVATAGHGPPVVLLHGFPQTHVCWRGIVPVLAERHTVVAPDLRGYGGTSAPPGGPHGEGFTKREMAADVVQLMGALGFDRFAAAGHDRGARVAYRMALDHPGLVQRLCVVNIIPAPDQFERMAQGDSLGYWPWLLLAQPAPFPETLIGARPEAFLRFVFDSWASRRDAIDQRTFEEYLDALRGPALAAMCADYRASFWLDQDDDRTDRDAGRRIECPLLVVTGTGETQLADAAEVWQRWAADVTAVALPGGHFVPEEAADKLAAVLLEFFGERR